MSAITTHVLDAVLGKPAPGIDVRLEKKIAGEWISLSEGSTDGDGRCRDLCHDGGSGAYRLTFAVDAYFASRGRISIYPEVAISFFVDGEHHYHIPLLLSDNSYTTYRGS
jgi:5-hydroxyisourate hydrolase